MCLGSCLVFYKIACFNVYVFNCQAPCWLNQFEFPVMAQINMRECLSPVRSSQVGEFWVPSIKQCHLSRPQRCVPSIALLALWNISAPKQNGSHSHETHCPAGQSVISLGFSCGILLCPVCSLTVYHPFLYSISLFWHLKSIGAR